MYLPLNIEYICPILFLIKYFIEMMSWGKFNMQYL